MKTATLDPLCVFLSDKIQAGLQQDERCCSLPLPPGPGQPGSEAGSEREQACERGACGDSRYCLLSLPLIPIKAVKGQIPCKATGTTPGLPVPKERTCSESNSQASPEQTQVIK